MRKLIAILLCSFLIGLTGCACDGRQNQRQPGQERQETAGQQKNPADNGGVFGKPEAGNPDNQEDNGKESSVTTDKDTLKERDALRDNERIGELRSKIASLETSLDEQLSENTDKLAEYSDGLRTRGFLAWIGIILAIAAIVIGIISLKKLANLTSQTDRIKKYKNEIRALQAQLQNLNKKVDSLKNEIGVREYRATNYQPQAIQPSVVTKPSAQPVMKRAETVYFAETEQRNGGIYLTTQVSNMDRATFCATISGSTAEFTPAAKADLNVDYAKPALEIIGTKSSGSRYTVLSPGVAVRDGNGWKITNKLRITFL